MTKMCRSVPNNEALSFAIFVEGYANLVLDCDASSCNEMAYYLVSCYTHRVGVRSVPTAPHLMRLCLQHGLDHVYGRILEFGKTSECFDYKEYNKGGLDIYRSRRRTYYPIIKVEEIVTT